MFWKITKVKNNNGHVRKLARPWRRWPQIFVESLLTSGNPKNIALAGEMMNTNKLHRPPTDGAAVDYEKAIELVLCAAHEYFDSAANLTDSSMELARFVFKLTAHPQLGWHIVCRLTSKTYFFSFTPMLLIGTVRQIFSTPIIIIIILK